MIVEHGHNIRSKYDFCDQVTKFFYDNAEIIFQKRTQTFNQSNVNAFMTEDSERLALYRKYGGWRTIDKWMQMAEPENIQNYFNVIKKHSLLREYHRNGFNIEPILKHSKFDSLTAMDIYRLIRSKADRIHTVILTNEEAEILNSHIKETLLHCMEVPDLGLQLPFPIMNDMVRGAKRKTVMAVGMLSNAGKTRLMTKILAYFTLCMHERVFVMLNEMSVEELRYALITTVINNPEFQKLHGIELKKPERELTLGKYKDENGDFIEIMKDDWGDPIETIDEFAERVAANSWEYVKIMEVAAWIEKETQTLIFVKDVAAAYDDKTLEFEIRKANLTLGAKYFFYDTFKNDIATTGDWAALKTTATKLTEVAKQLDMFGYLSIQLTDDANYCESHELTSSNIANAKQIKHVLHTLFLFKEIPFKKFHKYKYKNKTDWGASTEHELDPKKRYYCCVTDKNRAGGKKKLLFEVDLDLNIWSEVGELIVK